MNRILLISVVLLVPAIGVPMWTRSSGDLAGTGGARAPDARPLGASPPRAEPTIQGLGFVEPVSEVRKLAFKVNGLIARCPAEVGRRYRQGDVLAELDGREQLAALAVAEAEWRLAQARRAQVLSGVNPHRIEAAGHKVEMHREQVRYWEKEHDRARPLASRGAMSTSDYDRTFSDWTRGRAELRQAEADLQNLLHSVRDEDRLEAEASVVAARARLDLVRRQLEDTILRAPFDGTVLELLRREGEGARPSDPEPILIFGDTSRLRVRAEVDERFVTALRADRPATIFGKALRGREFPGRVVLVSPIMGAKTVFSRASTERKDLDIVQVLIEMGPDFSVPVGLEVDVQIITR
jgi:HlyD family secretion protein